MEFPSVQSWIWLKPVHTNELWNIQEFARQLLNTTILAIGCRESIYPIANTAQQGLHPTPPCPAEPVIKHLPEHHWGSETMKMSKSKTHVVSWRVVCTKGKIKAVKEDKACSELEEVWSLG